MEKRTVKNVAGQYIVSERTVPGIRHRGMEIIEEDDPVSDVTGFKKKTPVENRA